mgnify:CR=1 FL=1
MIVNLTKLAVIAMLSLAIGILASSAAHAQRQQYKIEPDGIVYKLKRVNVTTFQYVKFARAELRRDGEGNALWYFKAETGKEYIVPAPDQPALPSRYSVEQLEIVLERARARGEIPVAAAVEYERGSPRFLVRFERNVREFRWNAQVAMSAQEYEIVNRTLRQQGYQQLFAEPYTAADRSTRFFAVWRR